MSTWVNLNRAAKFPEVEKVYKRAGRGQGSTQSAGATTPASARYGFLTYVKRLVSETASIPSWVRFMPAGSNDWQNCQVDVTSIPGVRALRTNGKWVNFVA
jgi:hypothetical protein